MIALGVKLTRRGTGVSKKPLARTLRSVSIHVNLMLGGTPTGGGVVRTRILHRVMGRSSSG